MYYKRILDALPEMIYVTKDDGITATFYNKTWHDYTGLSAEDVEQGWAHIVAPYDLERVSTTILQAVENQEPYELELRLKDCKTDEYRWFLSRANPVFDEQGKLESYVGMSIDITDTKLSIRDMERVYENEMQKRIAKIKALEEELKIHNTGK